MHGGSRRVPVRQGRTGEHTAASHDRSAARDTVERLAEPVARAAGMELESVDVTRAGRRRLLRVVVDADGGVGLDAMALVSQELSTKLDASGIMGETPYTLEVTSPGVDRPLTQPRHWRRAVGRLVSVPVARGAGNGSPAPASTVLGRVTAAGDDGIVLDVEGRRREIGFGDLGPGKVQVEFRRDDMGESRGH
ncbi:MAG: ribosome maturation factor RimP [Micromonosporaceae bacterium]